jgi:hypothetical protein
LHQILAPGGYVSKSSISGNTVLVHFTGAGDFYKQYKITSDLKFVLEKEWKENVDSGD